MAIANYSTSIASQKTVGKIQTMLAAAGALKTMIDYDGGKPIALSFQVNTAMGLMGVRLPINPEGVLNTFNRDNVQKSFRSIEQAERTAWRNCEDWVKAQLAMIDAEQMSFDQVFLPYTMDKAGNTMYELFQQKRLMLDA